MARKPESETPYTPGQSSEDASEPPMVIPEGIIAGSTDDKGRMALAVASGSAEIRIPAPRPRKRTRKKAASSKRSGLASAIDVAQRLVHIAASEPEPDFLTHMRLQKLLYYAQGWSLALRDRPMFNGRIEAGAHGPVVREVYSRFADFGDGPILPERVPRPQGLSPEDREFIESVWEAYKDYSVVSLRAMAHGESPWRDARGDCAPADRCTTEITHDAMKRFFEQASKSHGQG